MQNKLYPLIVLLTLMTAIFLLNSCSLDRTNPLDPKGNADIEVPPEVLGINLSLIRHQGVPREIVMKWESLRPPVDGYYIYRSFSRNSKFELIHQENNVNVDQYRDRDIRSGKEYWYRISAYTEYPDGKLEGKLSSLREDGDNPTAVWVE